MKKTCMLAIALVYAVFSKAQVGVGTNTPDPSAQLHIQSSSKGLLIPRVALTGTNDVSTILSPVVSLLVYNTASAGNGGTAVVPGFYYWAGSAWLQFNTGPGALPGGATTGQMIFWNGTAWVLVPAGQPGQYLQLNQSGTPYWTGVLFSTLTTSNPTPTVYYTSLQTGGNITTDGGSAVTARGVCWSTTTGPTIASTKTTDGTGTGAYSSTLTNLSPATTYYMRAYATNSVGTAYGSEKIYTTVAASLATVSTTAVTAVTGGTASSGVTVSAENGSPVTARGICWSTSPNPTIADSKTTDGAGAGTVASFINGLATATTYYVRAYATNTSGTAYGNLLSFTTTSNLTIGGGYQGGMVAYIYQPGDPGYVAGQTHGLIAAPYDQVGAFVNTPWSNGLVDNVAGTALGTGLANSQQIWAYGIGYSTFSAATICVNLSLGGYNDWFLPSKDELNKLYLSKTAIGGFVLNYYWSSSGIANPASTGWWQNFNNGTQSNSGGSFIGLRAIRYF